MSAWKTEKGSRNIHKDSRDIFEHLDNTLASISPTKAPTSDNKIVRRPYSSLSHQAPEPNGKKSARNVNTSFTAGRLV